jgi:glycosyltransferase involved in cell wall biosynthesis
MNVKISLVTVCFNAAKTLERTLNSVAGQTYTNREHIIVDGGSTDGTCDLLERWKSRLAACTSGPDRGIYDAMNKGLSLATGDLICLLNADDWLTDRNVLSDVAQTYDAHIHSQGYTDNKIAIYGNFVMWLPWVHMCAVRRASPSVRSGMRLNHQSLFVHRAAYDATGPYALDAGLSADFDMVHRLHRAQVRFLLCEKPLAIFAKGGTGDQHWWRFFCETIRVQARYKGFFGCVPLIIAGLKSALGRAILYLLHHIAGLRAERLFLRYSLGAQKADPWIPAWCESNNNKIT